MIVTQTMERVAREWYNKPFNQLTTDEKFNVFDEGLWIDRNFDDPREREWYALGFPFQQPTRAINPNEQ